MDIEQIAVKMEESTHNTSSKFSEGFWDGVANIYGKHQLTNHKSDYELEFVNGVIDDMQRVDTLVCLGVADGSRDPFALLNYMKEKGMELPKDMYLNDLSIQLLGECQKTMDEHYDSIPLNLFPGPMCDIPNKVNRTFDNYSLVLGFYDANYLEQSLQGYLESSDVIGTTFKVGYTTFHNGEIVWGDGYTYFDIKDWKKHIEKLKSTRENAKNFLAFSIVTDKNFISHYWDYDMLKDMMESTFGPILKTISPVGDRYIVTLVEDNNVDNEKPKTLVTSLNNVMGNIPYEHQIESLTAIKKLISL